MHPIIGKIGPFTVFSYGVMLAVAVVVCAFLLSRDARRKGIASETIFDLVFWIMVSGLVGARIFYGLLNFEYFIKYPLDIVMIQQGGLAWQGGLISASVFTLIFLRQKKLTIPLILDLMAPYVALGQSIGRIGCFLNGCCYGKEVAWGIYFPVHHAHLHPTQLYSTIGLFLIFLILKAYQHRAKFAGEVFILYLILASMQRFFIEYLRGDHDILWLGLSIFQIVSIGIFISGILGHRYLANRVKN